jgi:hypothetical protein
MNIRVLDTSQARLASATVLGLALALGNASAAINEGDRNS